MTGQPPLSLYRVTLTNGDAVKVRATSPERAEQRVRRDRFGNAMTNVDIVKVQRVGQ
jgi:hypothetical protein